MANDVMQVDYDGLTDIAQRFGQANEGIELMRGNIQSTMESLRNNWEGEGSTAFFNIVEGQLLPAIQRLQEALQAGQATTQAVAQNTRQAEEEAAGVFNGDFVAETGGSGGSGGGSSSPGSAETASGEIKDRIRQALAGPGVDEAALNDILATSSPEDLKAIWSDPALMREVRDELGADKYLTFVVKTGMFQIGSVDHTSAATADSAIRDHLEQYVAQAVAEGKQISGAVGVVDDADWNEAGANEFGDYWNTLNHQINGFVDSADRVWIHKDRGNPGTMIHEAIHKYADDAMIHVSQPLNEGVTEYFTRSTTADLGLPERGNYQSNYEYVGALVNLVGEDTVADAYFDGNMDGLKSAYLNTGYSESDWNRMILHTRNDQWADAETYVQPR